MSHPACILIVDDDDDIRDAVIDALGDEGIGAVGAREGTEALNLLRRDGLRPAVILVDLRMPGMSGADFVALKQADEALADIPVVLLTADAGAAEKATDFGAIPCLRKPIKLDALIQTVKRFVATG